ncbi:MAG: hypothetical protein ACRD22_01710 [Terriglobia bacterium]
MKVGADSGGNISLSGKRIAQRTIVTSRPDANLVFHTNKPGQHSQLIVGRELAALNNITSA